MSDNILKLMDPEILEGMKRLPPELTEGGPINQSYLAMRELIKGMELTPFENTYST